jgi:hypothetical protein
VRSDDWDPLGSSEQAWIVVEGMRARGYVDSHVRSEGSTHWSFAKAGNVGSAIHEDDRHAVCLAAARAISGEVKE